MTQEELLATVEELRLPMDDTYFPVIRFGRGSRAFVLLSGVSLCGLEGAGNGVAAAYADFAEDYTVYLLDRRRALPEGFTVADMAEDAYRALTALGVAQADVYGVSQGGMMALCLALAHPELVRTLSLCSTQARAGERMRETAERWMNLAAKGDTVALNRDFSERVYSAAYRARYGDAFRAMEQTGTPADCARFAVMVRACGTFDVYDRLTEIRCPVLVMADENDAVIDPRSSLEMIEALGCEHWLYSQYSHAVYDESADVPRRVLDFIRRC